MRMSWTKAGYFPRDTCSLFCMQGTSHWDRGEVSHTFPIYRRQDVALISSQLGCLKVVPVILSSFTQDHYFIIAIYVALITPKQALYQTTSTKRNLIPLFRKVISYVQPELCLKSKEQHVVCRLNDYMAEHIWLYQCSQCSDFIILGSHLSPLNVMIYLLSITKRKDVKN